MKRHLGLNELTVCSLCLLAIGLSLPSSAQQYMPTSNLVLPSLPPGARGIALAGAGGTASADAFAVYYNPANLLTEESFSVAGDGVSFPAPKSDITAWSYSFYGAYGSYALPQVTFGASLAVRKADLGNFLGNDFSETEFLATVAVARKFSQSLHAGIALKIGNASIEIPSPESDGRILSCSAGLFAIDFGLLLHQILRDPVIGSSSATSGLHVGIVFKEIGPTYEYFPGQGDPLPSNMRLGISYGWLNAGDVSATVLLDLVKYLNDRDRYTWFNAIFSGLTDQSISDELRHLSYLAGLEVGYGEMLFVRVGWGRDFTPAINTWTAGIGARDRGVGVDLAYVSKMYLYAAQGFLVKDTNDGLRFTLSYAK
jgi:hypothetical protein